MKYCGFPGEMHASSGSPPHAHRVTCAYERSLHTRKLHPTTGVHSAGGNAPDWLQQASAVVAKPRHHKASASQRRVGGGRKVTAQSPLLWMSSMKRRSSMDLEDSDAQAAIVQAKAKTAVPGGWLQIGALGAPDAVEEGKKLEEARAASSLAR